MAIAAAIVPSGASGTMFCGGPRVGAGSVGWLTVGLPGNVLAVGIGCTVGSGLGEVVVGGCVGAVVGAVVT